MKHAHFVMSLIALGVVAGCASEPAARRTVAQPQPREVPATRDTAIRDTNSNAIREPRVARPVSHGETSFLPAVVSGAEADRWNLARDGRGSNASGYSFLDDPNLTSNQGTRDFPMESVVLDLPSVLSRVAGQNPRVAFAAERYREAYAQLEAARALWLPSIRAGISFNHHDGTLQASGGDVIDVSRSSLQSGLGVHAVGAGTPAVPGLVASFHTADAILEPRIANRAAAARQETADAVTNDMLLAVAVAHLELLRAAQLESIASATLTNAQALAELTASFASTGQGPQADADRAQTELAVRRNDQLRAQETLQVASARLAELLSMDPTRPVAPGENSVVPLTLVSLDQTLSELLAIGLSNRPELAASRHLVCEAVYRYRREKFAPLVPSVLLGISYGGFGGGDGSSIDNFRDRFDLDAVAFWEIRNFGFGERAARDATRSRYDQARLLEIQMLDQIAREVVEAHAQAQMRFPQIGIAGGAVVAAENSYRRNAERIRQGQGLPIEVLQSIQALDQARREYLRAVSEYNEAQFRLQRALGWPIAAITRAEAGK